MKALKSIIILTTIFISVFTITSLVTSCKKETANKAPEIAILEPTANDTVTISVDPELHVEFTATDDEGLHTLSVKIKTASATLFNDTSAMVHDLKTYNYHEHYTFSGITTLTPATVEITAEDHDEVITMKTIQVYVKP